MAQIGRPDGQMPMGEARPVQNAVPDTLIDLGDRIWAWKMIDDFTLVDTVDVDTITSGFQNYDLIFKDSFSNIYLGNKGSAYTSNLMSYKSDFNEFIFINSLYKYFIQPEDISFYNTKVPYTNLTYVNAGPKRRSEENFSGLFTQNINKEWNLGFKYNLVSSVGTYEAQQVDNRNFNFFLSYYGKKYGMHTVLTFNRIRHLENGGLDKDDHDLILNRNESNFRKDEDIPVKYMSATNSIDNYQLFFNQSLGIGKINLNKGLQIADSTDVDDEYKEELELPISTVYHNLHVGSYKRAYSIDGLDRYYDDNNSIPLYNNVYGDSLKTRDSTRYTYIKNTFQIKFNEEANSLLKFGLRVYLTNEVKNYRFQVAPQYFTQDGATNVVYRHNDTTLVSSTLGGQIFKNLGKNLWWNAGGKIYFQGYRTGDIELTGNLNSLYKVFNDTAGVYGKGKVMLRSAELFQEKYFSNHFIWDDPLKQEKQVTIEAGLNIPTRRLKVSWESKVITDYIYWNYEAIPAQSSEVINAFQVTLLKHFKFGPFHSNNKLAYQFSSHQKLYPLPDFTGYSSNYFNFYLAKRVLNMQVGFDVKYHTAYYTQAYMPATGQFYLQNEIKVGDYPFMDAFVNLQLKRARIFIKVDHFNQKLMDNNYFLTLGYPHAGMRIKWGVSWNFYD